MSIDLIKENDFTLKKVRSRKISCRNCNSRRLFRWSSSSCKYTAQAKSLLHSLKQKAGDIGLYVNANNIEYMCFKWVGAISILSGRLLKFVDKFAYHGNHISSTESIVNIHLVKVWATIIWLSIIWKSDLVNKI